MSNALKEKFDGKAPAEKAQFFRSLRALFYEAAVADAAEMDEAEMEATNALLADLDRLGRYYARKAELEDRRRFWDATEGP